MSKQFNRIGNYISVIDNRNSNGEIDKLMGISIGKCYIPSVANVIGTDLKNYKVIRRGQFACSLMQVSRDQRIPIAMYSDETPAIMSPAYVMFEVNKSDEILPEYMELWFRRAEFDREASFYAVGGVRGSLDWEDFCNMKLPVPSIDEQRKIVHGYQVITERVELLLKINKALEHIGLELFKNSFINKKDELQSVSLYSLAEYVNGTSFSEEEYSNDGLPIIKIAELKDGITYATQYFIGEKPEKYYIKNGDVLFSWSGNPETSIDAFIWTHGDGILNQHAFKMGCTFGQAFTYFLLKYCKPEFVKAAHGKQTTGLGHITITDLQRLAIPFSTSFAIKFNDQAQEIYDYLYHNLLEINALKKIKQNMLKNMGRIEGA